MLLRRPLFLLLLAACTASPTSTADVPNAITLMLPVAEIKVGDEIQLTADVRNGADAPLPSAVLEWSTDAPAIATISRTGRLLGVTAGTVQVMVRSGGVSDRRSVTVRPIVPFSISIEGLPATIRVGERVRLVADVRAEGGYQLINASVSWSVDLPAIATVDAFGDLVGLAPGTVQLTATSNAVRTTRAVMILPGIAARIAITGNVLPLTVGANTQLSAKLMTASGVLLPDTPVTWSSTNAAVATVSSGGFVIAVSVGQTIIRASAGAVSDSVILTVVAEYTPVHQIAFLRLIAPTTYQIEVVAEDGSRLRSMLLPASLRTPSLASGPTATLSAAGDDVVFDCNTGICWLNLASGTMSQDNPGSGLSEPTLDYAGNGLLLRGDYSSVVRYSPAGGLAVTRRAPFYVERPRISPDGQNVLYECDYYQQYDPLDNLCRMDASGQVTLYKSIANAVSWSPRDGTVAYVRSLDWTKMARMLVIEPLQAQPNPNGPGVTEYSGFDDVTETAWSPDGQRLALVRNGELWIYSLPGMTNPVRIAHIAGTTISSVSWR